MKNIILQYIFKRLTEASTLKGIILSVSSASGLVLSQDQTNSAVWIVLGIVGIIGSLMPDTFGKVVKENVPTVSGGTTSEVSIVYDQPSELESRIPEPPYKKSQPTTDTGWNDK